MKKVFNFFMCAAIMAAGFVGCSNEEIDPNKQQGDLSGILTIRFTEPESYASDDNALDSETKVQTLDIWVYQSGQLIHTVPTVINPSFNANNEHSVTIKGLPLGNVTVYAGLNLTTAMRSKLGTDIVGTGSAVDLENLAGIQRLYKSNEFPMFNVETKIINLKHWDGQGNNPNLLTIGVERMVAKVYLQQQNGGVDITAGESTSNAYFDITADDATKGLGFLMGQMNRWIYPFAGAVDWITHTDPNWSAATIDAAYHAANFVNEFSVNPQNVVTGETWSAVSSYKADPKFGTTPAPTVRYTPENTTKSTQKGESTYAAIRTRFCPKTIYEYTQNHPTVKETVAAADFAKAGFEDLYVVVYGPNVYYFAGAAGLSAAQAFVDDLNTAAGWPNSYPQGAPAPYRYDWYKNQYCYYYVFLDGNKNYGPYQTIRNNLYQITINNLNSLGRPTPEIDEKEWENPIDGKSDLDVTIDIVKWNVVKKEVDLNH